MSVTRAVIVCRPPWLDWRDHAGYARGGRRVRIAGAVGGVVLEVGVARADYRCRHGRSFSAGGLDAFSRPSVEVCEAACSWNSTAAALQSQAPCKTSAWVGVDETNLPMPNSQLARFHSGCSPTCLSSMLTTIGFFPYKSRTGLGHGDPRRGSMSAPGAVRGYVDRRLKGAS